MVKSLGGEPLGDDGTGFEGALKELTAVVAGTDTAEEVRPLERLALVPVRIVV